MTCRKPLPDEFTFKCTVTCQIASSVPFQLLLYARVSRTEVGQLPEKATGCNVSRERMNEQCLGVSCPCIVCRYLPADLSFCTAIYSLLAPQPYWPQMNAITAWTLYSQYTPLYFPTTSLAFPRLTALQRHHLQTVRSAVVVEVLSPMPVWWWLPHAPRRLPICLVHCCGRCLVGSCSFMPRRLSAAAAAAALE
jgi:hypothetical protein